MELTRNRESAKLALEAGFTLSYEVWQFSGTYMDCYDGCCEDSFSSIEELLDQLKYLCDEKWDNIKILEDN